MRLGNTYEHPMEIQMKLLLGVLAKAGPNAVCLHFTNLLQKDGSAPELMFFRLPLSFAISARVKHAGFRINSLIKKCNSALQLL
ncbi:MAG: hypothetical protein ABW007_03135 [Chitinophagaceae bacterium]